MGSNSTRDHNSLDLEQPDLKELDAALRQLAGETHPRPGFIAQLRGAVEQKTALPVTRHRWPSLAWARPLAAQGALVLLMLGLVALALVLVPHLQERPTPLPGVQRGPSGTPRPAGTPALDENPPGVLARLGKGSISALDSNQAGLIAVGAGAGVCVYDQAMQEQWCAWTDAAVTAAAYNPSGDLLALGLGDGRLQIRDAAAGDLRDERASRSYSTIHSLAWDPSGAPVIASMDLAGQVEAWDWQNDRLRWGPLDLRAAAAGLAWARGAGGESLLAAGGDNGLAFLDGETGEQKLRFEPTWQVSPVLGISALAFSPGDGAPWLAYAYRGGIAALKMDGWQISAARNWPLGANDSEEVTNSASAAFSIAFSRQAGSPRLAAARPDGMRIIQVEEDALAEPVSLPVHSGAPLLWTTTGRLVFTLPSGALGMAAPGGGAPDTTLSEYTTFLLDMTWGSAGVVSTNGAIDARAWNTDGSLGHISPMALESEIDQLVLSPDGELVACVLKNGASVVVWDLINDRPAWTVDLATQVKLAAFSPDGAKLALATEDGAITAYDRLTGRVTGQGSISLPVGHVTAIAWAPPSYGYDVVAVAWSREGGADTGGAGSTSFSGLEIASLDSRLDWSTKSVARGISPLIELAWGPGGPDSDGFLAGFQSEQVVVWDARSGAEVYRIGESPLMASVFFPTLAVSPSGARIAYTSRGGITVWDMAAQQPLQFFAGQDGIRRLAFSEDGSRLASAALDGAIILWDLTAAAPMPTPTPLPPEPVETTPPEATTPTTEPAPPVEPQTGSAVARLGYGAIAALDTAPDGRLAVGTSAGVCVHNNGMAVAWCRWLGGVSRVAFDPSGETLVVALARPLAAPEIPLLILNAGDGSTLAQRSFKLSDAWTMPGSARLAWDPSGAPRIAVAESGGLLSVWDWPADQIAWGAVEVSGPYTGDNSSGYISALDWSSGPSGESLLAAASSLGLSLIDGATGDLKQRYDAGWEVTPVGKILALAFAPDDGMGGPGRHLAYTAENGDLYVLEMQGWQAAGASHFQVPTSGSPVQPVAAQLAWAPAAGSLLSMRLAQMLSGDVQSYPPAVYIYEPFQEGAQPQSIPAAPFSPIAWGAEETFRSPTGSLRAASFLMYHDPSGMLARYTDQGAAPYPLDYTFGAEALAWPAPGDLFGLSRRTTSRWDVAGTRLGAVSLVAESKWTPLMAVSPDGQFAAYLQPAQDDLLLWGSANNQRITLIDASPGRPASGSFRAAAFSADGSRIATVSTGGELALWHVPSGQPIRGGSPLEGASQIDALALSPDGSLAAIAWTDAQSPRISLYRFLGGEIVADISTQETITALTFSPDGRQIAAAGGLTVRIIDAASGDILHALGPEIDPDTFGTDALEPASFSTLAFSPDGSTLATGGRLVTLWDTNSGALLKTFKGHAGAVIALAFRPDGGLLASTATDGAILIWDLGAGPLPEPEITPTPTPIP